MRITIIAEDTTDFHETKTKASVCKTVTAVEKDNDQITFDMMIEMFLDVAAGYGFDREKMKESMNEYVE